ncbi:MAG: hydroxyacid dehydrogenase [bacterium]|nr:hydroxyacid dehydrogenase [bacterium]
MKVLVSDKVADSAVKQMRGQGHDVTVKTGLAPEELEKIIGEFECIIVRSATKVKKNIIDAGKNLKLVIRGGVGVDNIDVEYAKSKNIEVKNTPAASSESVAELAIAHMLSLARALPIADKSMKEGKWEKKKFEGTELYKKTLGVIGLGRIGREAARIGFYGFSMNVLGYDPFVKEVSQPPVKVVSLEQILRESDYITLHLPLTAESKHMISSSQFKMMKKSAFLVSCARGGIVDETALLDALKNQVIKGAALDVFETEPVVRNELFDLENFMSTPHIGAQTLEAQERVADEIVKIMADYK